MPVFIRPGDLNEIAIQSVAHGGDGVGRIGEVVCFVSGALPGDVVQARVYRCANNAVWARLTAIVEPSPDRVVPSPCSGRGCDSACRWHDFSYPAQGEWKRRIVEECLARIGGIVADVALLEAPEHRLGYRTRAAFHGDGSALGYYRQRTHDVIRLEACPLNHFHLNAALQRLQPLCIKGDVHVAVNPEGEDVLVWQNEPSQRLRAAFPLTNGRLDRERFQFLFDGVPIVNGAFSQSSLLLNRLLRAHVDACLEGAESLLDLYCGNGNLSLHHARTRKVIGVDHAGAAVAAAAALVPGAYRQGGEDVMMEQLRACSWDAVLLDPPRTGAKAIVKDLAAARTDKIVYVSCNPATLARDLRELLPGGWRLMEAVAMDLFPHTPHVESVCLLRRG